jgi:hypothetical protein
MEGMAAVGNALSIGKGRTGQRRALRRRHLITTLVATVAMYGVGVGFLVEQGQGDHGAWAHLSDAAALLFGLSLVPVVVGVSDELDRGDERLSRTDRVVGLIAAGCVGAGAAWLLVAAFGLLPVEGWAGLLVQLIGMTLVGVWLLLVGTRTLRTGRWSRVVGWAAVISGAGYTAGGVVAGLQLFESPLFVLAYAAALGGFLTWLTGLLRVTR